MRAVTRGRGPGLLGIGRVGVHTVSVSVVGPTQHVQRALARFPELPGQVGVVKAHAAVHHRHRHGAGVCAALHIAPDRRKAQQPEGPLQRRVLIGRDDRRGQTARLLGVQHGVGHGVLHARVGPQRGQGRRNVRDVQGARSRPQVPLRAHMDARPGEGLNSPVLLTLCLHSLGLKAAAVLHDHAPALAALRVHVQRIDLARVAPGDPWRVHHPARHRVLVGGDGHTGAPCRAVRGAPHHHEPATQGRLVSGQGCGGGALGGHGEGHRTLSGPRGHAQPRGQLRNTPLAAKRHVHGRTLGLPQAHVQVAQRRGGRAGRDRGSRNFWNWSRVGRRAPHQEQRGADEPGQTGSTHDPHRMPHRT